MKALKWLGILLGVYVGIVVLFESLLGYFQPENPETLIITTYDDGGEGSDRVLAHIKMGDTTYVAANHWPRAWFREALENPAVDITLDGTTTAYTAVLVTDVEEFTKVDEFRSLPLGFRILTGFPPRYIMRMDPR